MSKDKPLFVPLKTEYYEAFVSGEKKFEYRRHGPGWNAHTCQVGRPVTISKGYGREHRRSGIITSFEVILGSNAPNPDQVHAVYGTTDIEIAKIGIKLDA